MGSGSSDDIEFSYPSHEYRPPIRLLGGVLWTLAIVTVSGIWVAADFDEAFVSAPAALASTGRVFIGVFLFVIVFPVVFRIRRRARRA
ncbi:hypothetical protein GCM10008994_14840 [Halorubrum ejinorense]|uniref:Uncharacterized protein n=1 Tax=Halorubrum ejinorense TaxID=425309 RepID=A0AAV3SSE0_9EURY